MESEEKKISVSVAMGVYNPEDISALKQAVDSVLNQTLRELELIIYDDGSCAESAEELRHIAELDGRVRLLRGEENRGLAYALNVCIREAKGEYIARMDADDVSAPERLREQKKFLDTHGDYAFVGTAAKLFDVQGVWGERRMVSQPGTKEFLKYSPYIHPTVMFRKNVLTEAGGYLDSEDTRRCEDYELFMRLYCKQQYGYNIDKVLFSYREDRTWYDKRRLCQRMAELKIRYQGFRAMGILNPKTMIYVAKPVLMVLLPRPVRRYLRRKSITTAE